MTNQLNLSKSFFLSVSLMSYKYIYNLLNIQLKRSLYLCHTIMLVT